MLRIKQTNGLDFSMLLTTSPHRLPILPFNWVFHELWPAAGRGEQTTKDDRLLHLR